MKQFKVGDKVRRINYGGELRIGEVYTVSDVYLNNIGVAELSLGEDNPTPFDAAYFELVETFEQNITKSEADIVKEWFGKLKWLDDNTPIAAFGGFVTNEVDEMNDASDCVDFVINSYDYYQQKIEKANKEKLQSEKDELMKRIAEIDSELNKAS